MPSGTDYQLPDMRGRTAIVTGANSGLGRANRCRAGPRPARTSCWPCAIRPRAGRPADGMAAAATAAGGAVEVRKLDLASLRSVRVFAAGWDGALDVLVNNAGVMVPPLSRTEDGFELQFGTNHLGHFALANLLLPYVTARGRIVTVSSVAHRLGRIDFDDLNWERRRYAAWLAYGQSKLANLLFSAELQRKLVAAGADALATAAHPGYAATNLQFHSGRRSFDLLSRLGNLLLAQSSQAGARPSLYAATADIPATASSGPAASSSCAAGPRSSRARPRPRTPRTHAGCGACPSS